MELEDYSFGKIKIQLRVNNGPGSGVYLNYGGLNDTQRGQLNRLIEGQLKHAGFSYGTSYPQSNPNSAAFLRTPPDGIHTQISCFLEDFTELAAMHGFNGAAQVYAHLLEEPKRKNIAVPTDTTLAPPKITPAANINPSARFGIHTPFEVRLKAEMDTMELNDGQQQEVQKVMVDARSDPELRETYSHKYRMNRMKDPTVASSDQVHRRIIRTKLADTSLLPSQQSEVMEALQRMTEEYMAQGSSSDKPPTVRR